MKRKPDITMSSTTKSVRRPTKSVLTFEVSGIPMLRNKKIYQPIY